ncbi:restriction endonuclease [Alicyclobacillus curvatus]|nr:restriction endonuclease [Alicyclobacillus curvatus]
MTRQRRRRVSKKESMGVLLLVILLFVIRYPALLLLGILLLALVVAGWIFVRSQKTSRLKRSGIGDIDKMEGVKFEQYLGVLFSALGYKVRVTKASGDFGADLILQKDGKRILVQAKRYDKPVGVKAIQEVSTALAYYGGSEAWVVTNNTYTSAAVSLARSNHVSLIDRQSLIRMILKVQKQPQRGSEAEGSDNLAEVENETVT